MLDDLRHILSGLYPDKASAERVVKQAHINDLFIDYTGSASNIWQSVIQEAKRRGQVERIVAVAASDYPENTTLQRIAGAYQYGAPNELTIANDDSTHMTPDPNARLSEEIAVLRARFEAFLDKYTRDYEQWREDTKLWVIIATITAGIFDATVLYFIWLWVR